MNLPVGSTGKLKLLIHFTQALELRQWPESHPLRQMESLLTPELLYKMEERGLSLERLQDMSRSEIGAFLRHPAAGAHVGLSVCGPCTDGQMHAGMFCWRHCSDIVPVVACLTCLIVGDAKACALGEGQC